MAIILDLSEEDKELFSKEYANLGEINSAIEKLENETPEKGSDGYDLWKTKINFLIDLYNKNAHYKSFKKVE